jgi:hypothetical protein
VSEGNGRTRKGRQGQPLGSEAGGSLSRSCSFSAGSAAIANVADAMLMP